MTNPLETLATYNLPNPIEDGQVSIRNLVTIRKFALAIPDQYRDKDTVTASKLETNESKAFVSQQINELRSMFLGNDDATVVSAARMLKEFLTEIQEFIPDIIGRHKAELASEHRYRAQDKQTYEALKTLVSNLVGNAETITKLMDPSKANATLSELFPDLAPFNPVDSKKLPGQMSWPKFGDVETFGRNQTFVTKLAWSIDDETLPLKSTPNDVMTKIWPNRAERPTTSAFFDLFGNANEVLKNGNVTFEANGRSVKVWGVTSTQG